MWTAIALAALRVAPLVIGSIQGAEQKFTGEKRGEDKRNDVLRTVLPVAEDATKMIVRAQPTQNVLQPQAGSDAELRKAIAWTIDAAVAWMKYFGRL